MVRNTSRCICPRARFSAQKSECHRKGWWILPVLLAGLFLAFQVAAAPGDLDTGFGSGDGDGTDGLASWDSGEGYDTGRAVALQPDGKILVAGDAHGSSDDDLGLIRFNADGSLDTAFATNGPFTWDSGTGFDSLKAIAVQPDGKILAAGDTHNGSDYDLVLARFHPGGSLDTGFGASDGDNVDGMAIWASGSNDEHGRAIALQPDGKIVVAGSTAGFSDPDVLLVRFNPNGTPDTGFGTGGGATTWDGGNGDLAQAVAVRPDGRILIGGWRNNGSNNDLALLRFNASGSLDTSFGNGDGDGTNGLAIWDSGGGETIWGLALQPDGKILVAGGVDSGTSQEFLLARFHPGGLLDTTGFSPGTGTFIKDLGGERDRALDVALQPDGKILGAGYGSLSATNSVFMVVRLESNGSPDTTFGGGDGLVTLDNGTITDKLGAVTIQPDGAIVVGGEAYLGGDTDFAAARFQGGAWGASAWALDPDPFSFTDQEGVRAGSSVTSNSVAISGLGTGLKVPVHTGTGGLTVLDDTGTQVETGAPFAWVGNGYSLQVTHTAAASGGTKTSVVEAGGLRPATSPGVALGATQSAAFTSTASSSGGSGGGGGCVMAPSRTGLDPLLVLLILLAGLGLRLRGPARY